MIRKFSQSFLMFLAPLILLSSTAQSAAFDLAITSSIAPNGSTLLRLSGTYLGCIIYDESAIMVAAGRISVNTLYHPTQSCLGVPPPGPVNITVNAGSLAAGHYDVIWTFGGPPSLPVATARFEVLSAVPAFGVTAQLLTTLLIAAFGALSLVRIRRWVD